MATLFFLLDTCGVKSSTAYSLNQKKDPRKENSFDYGWKLRMELVFPHIYARPINGLSPVVQQKIRFILGLAGPDKEGSQEPNLKTQILSTKSEVRR